ncbi:MAG: ABC transporter permease [Bacteroidales bacterium]|jgi:putative ABC transport system permease protein|nr:ABC transporter permease [Bacteroidales bacterium]
MFDLDRWQEIYSTLRKNKLRTIMTAFGVFWGIFMLVVMLGAGRGIENGVTSGMGDFATNSAFMWTQTTTIPWKGFPKGRRFTFTNEDIKALRDNVPEIDMLAPRIQRGEVQVMYGLSTGTYQVQGDYPDFNAIDPVEILKGRFINEIDINSSRKVAVVGKRVIADLFEPDEEPVGKYIRIQGVYFQVIGVFASKHTGGWGENQEQCITLPFTSLQKVFNIGNRVYFFAMTSKPRVSVSQTIEKAKVLMLARHSCSPDDKEAIGSDDVEEQFKKIGRLFSGIAALVWLVGAGTLLAGIIGISNIMLVVVKERTREIGIQRAIGARPRTIISAIMLEAVVLTAIAGYFGLVCGVGIVELVDHLFPPSPDNMFAHPEVHFGTAMYALGILVISGAIAGSIPAYRAIKVKPIEALRYE